MRPSTDTCVFGLRGVVVFTAGVVLLTACLGFAGIVCGQVALPGGTTRQTTPRPTVQIATESPRIGMGRSARLDAAVTLPDGKPAAGHLLLPYVNGKRWGAHQYADAQGRATFYLPLPQPGIAEIQVETLPPGEKWSWTRTMTDSQMGRQRLQVGTPLPETAALSNRVTVQVDRRRLAVMASDPEHLVGAQYCTLFTPQNFNWTTAQAVPLVGFYRSWDPDIVRQHLIWLVESGVDFLLVDWSNQLWDRRHWDQRSDAANEVVRATTMLLETAAAMREQGLPVPRIVIFVGVNNGPSTTMVAINEEILWIYHNYIGNPRFQRLFLEYLGKPLLIVFNGGGPAWLKDTHQAPVDERNFTIRWMSSQHQLCRHNEAGYWSWMDGSLRQPVTLFQGKPEAMTASTAFFDQGGWKAPTAFGRRGGWTYLESFKGALQQRPRFLQLHQFQEFTGAPEGSQAWYGDSYSVELSDDIEPVSLTTPAYRGHGGWGFHYLNLTRALVDLYRQKTPQTTVLAIAHPGRREVVAKDRVPVQWTWVGKPPTSFSIALNGTTVARDLRGTEAVIDLTTLKDGPALLRLTADGTQDRYPLSFTQDSLPQSPMLPASMEVEIVRNREMEAKLNDASRKP